MTDWTQYTTLAQILGGLLGIAYAYFLCLWFERKDKKRDQKELEEYARKLREQYK